MNYKKATTSELQVFSERLYSYYQQLSDYLKHFNQAEQSGQVPFDYNNAKTIVSKELAVVSGAMEMIQEEMSVRMEQKMGLKLMPNHVMAILQDFAEVASSVQQQRNHEHKLNLSKDNNA